MDFSFTPDQIQFRETLRHFLAERCNFSARQQALYSDSGWQPEVWKAYAQELGLLGLPLAEDVGGMAGNMVDVMVVMEELGRALPVDPYLESIVFCGQILSHTNSSIAKAALTGMVNGESIAALAWEESNTRYDFSAIATQAVPDGAGWRLTGSKKTVIAAPWATDLLVALRTQGKADDADGLSLFLIPVGTAGLTLSAYPTIDGKRAADIEFSNLYIPQEALIGSLHDGLALLESARDAAIAAQCAEACGILRRMLEDTVEYTKQRRQFGQPISSFQVLQHRMVDMYLQLEMAVSATYRAVLKQTETAHERAKACSSAKVTIANACRFIGQNAVQLHGGMGMTDEMAISHYFKRATAIEREFGSADYHLNRYMRLESMANH